MSIMAGPKIIGLNADLLKSIGQDLKSISKVVADISSWFGKNINNFSWRYPNANLITIDCNKILESYEEQTPADHYILLLELVHDRMHALLYLIIEFMDTTPPVAQMFTFSADITTRPGNLTMAALVTMFWRRMEFMHSHLLKLFHDSECQSIVQNVDELLPPWADNPSTMTVSRGSQTSVSILTTCESCHIMAAIIKTIILQITQLSAEYKIDVSHVAKKVKGMRTELFNMTQWAAMQEWSDAICSDLRSLATAFHFNQQRNEKLRGKLKSRGNRFILDFINHNDKVLHLAKHVGELDLIVRKSTKTTSVLLNEAEEIAAKLTMRNTEILALDVKGTNFEEKHNEMKKRIQEMEAKINCFNVLMVELDEKMNQSINYWKDKYETEQREHDKMKTKLTKALVELDEQTKSVKTMKHQFQAMKNDIEHLHQAEKIWQNKSVQTGKIMQDMETTKALLVKERGEDRARQSLMQDKILQLEKELTEREAREAVLLQYPDPNGPIIQKELQYNPIVDMEAQRHANKLRIKLLMQHNKTLKRTINKIQQLGSQSPVVEGSRPSRGSGSRIHKCLMPISGSNS